MQRSAWQIGGVFPLEDVNNQVSYADSLYSAWLGLGDVIGLFQNARSAISYTVKNSAVKSVWLPAYICEEVSNLFEGSEIALNYYRLDALLSPEIDELEVQLSSGDVVLFVNYFGMPQAKEFRQLVKARPDIIWVEDASQTIFYDGAPVGDYIIFSPRKIVGVPDGGVLIAKREGLPAPSFDEEEASDLIEPYLLRANSETQYRNDLWFPAYQLVEARHRVCMASMSSLSVNRLGLVNAESIKQARQRNYRVLFDALRDYSFFQHAPAGWVPFGFPIVCECAAALQRRLAARSVFAPRHWASLSAPEDSFGYENKLSRRLLTLPCDQRYSTKDMRKVATIVGEELVV